MMKEWTYNNNVIKNLDDIYKYNPNAFGFVYQLDLYDKESGNLIYSYIGKKNLFNKRKKKFGKRKIAQMKDKRKKKYEIVVSESNWKDYYSSNKYIKENYSDYNIERTILNFYETSYDLTFYEAKEIICSGALETSHFLNEGVKITRYAK